MKIGIDGFNLAMPNGTGVATYAFALAAAVKSMGHRIEGIFGLPVGKDPAIRELQFYDAFLRVADSGKRVTKWQRRRELLNALGSNIQALDVSISDRVEKGAFAHRMPQFDRLTSATMLFERAFEHFRLRKGFISLRMADPPAVMHWTYPVPIVLQGARNIYTLHDLVPLRLPYTTLDNKDLYHGILEGCIAHAAQICTVSEASRADIVAHFPDAASKVVNTYQTAPLSIDIGQSAEDDAKMIEGIFGLPHRSYFLYFGAIEPKKNVGRLIEAYLSLQTETPLVIVGARAWQSDSELRLMPGGGADGSPGTYHGQRGQKIVRLTYLPRDLLARLARGAKAVVFPSLFEGFGLPVLEAMQLGTPVITTNTSSLPEIVGDAALLIDPYKVETLVDAMRRVDADAALRDRMAERGIVEAGRFSEVHYRDRLALLYDRAMAQPVAGR